MIYLGIQDQHLSSGFWTVHYYKQKAEHPAEINSVLETSLLSMHMEGRAEDIKSEDNKLTGMDFSINTKHARWQLSLVTSSAS